MLLAIRCGLVGLEFPLCELEIQAEELVDKIGVRIVSLSRILFGAIGCADGYPVLASDCVSAMLELGLNDLAEKLEQYMRDCVSDNEAVLFIDKACCQVLD